MLTFQHDHFQSNSISDPDNYRVTVSIAVYDSVAVIFFFTVLYTDSESQLDIVAVCVSVHKSDRYPNGLAIAESNPNSNSFNYSDFIAVYYIKPVSVCFAVSISQLFADALIDLI